MNQILNKQIERMKKQEQKILNTPQNALLKSTITPIVNKLENKIPDKIKQTLDAAFYKGFQLVFEKGSPYIEKTYNKDKIELEFDVNNYALKKRINKKHLKQLDKQSKQSKLLNSSISIVEGSLLGLAGIGLPDIPLLLSLIVKSIFEIALSYGYQYDSQEEKAYILLLICGAVSRNGAQNDFDRELEALAEKLDNHNSSITIDFENYMKSTAGVLSDTLLAAKFIQGIPVVGLIGGAVNYSVLNRITTYAGIKYKKRYLMNKVME